jgi:major vault protein
MSNKTTKSTGSLNSIKIPPFYYIHVLNRNDNVTRLETGPQTFIRQDHEQVVTGDSPQAMIVIPPRQYCEIANPVVLDKTGAPSYDKYGQVIIRHGDFEIRFNSDYPEPFALFPGEGIKTAPTALTVLKPNTALRLEATRNFEDNNKKKYTAGDQWLIRGPCTYYPRVEEKVISFDTAIIIGPQQALRLRARQDFVDRKGVERKTGDEWLIRTSGSFLPDINEESLGVQQPYTITDKSALQLRALKGFTDFYGIVRKPGEEWIILPTDTSYHILDVFEEFVKSVSVTVLRKNEYCFIADPLDPKTKQNKLGAKVLRVGEKNFFLMPGESILGKIENAKILQEDAGLLLRAQQEFTDDQGVLRKPGERWMIYGPSVYVPVVEVEILESRQRVCLDTNEGVYVRDINTGQVRCEMGKSYMLKAHEEFWEKELTELEETLLAKNRQYSSGKRDKTKVVTFRCSFANIVQIYDYKRKESRIVVGPALVHLGADEQFTVTLLSGDTPKKPGVIRKLSVDISPTFTSDVVTVETSDHTRLNLRLAYNWYFKVNTIDPKSISKIYEIGDFIGYICSQLSSKVRSAVAAVGFDEFHKNSAKIIRKSVLGTEESGKVKDEFIFETNQVAITNVDIKSVEPVDKITLDNIQKAVTQAIEISTKSLEAHYKYQSDMMEQQALGQIDKINIDFQSRAEEAKKKLYGVRAESERIQNTGTATAEAKSRAEAAKIESETKVKIAQLKASARKIQSEAELLKRTGLLDVEVNHNQAIAGLDIDRTKRLSEIESNKFKEIVGAFGQKTMVAISNAGQEFQNELFRGLGLSSYLEGNNPMNMFKQQ